MRTINDEEFQAELVQQFFFIYLTYCILSRVKLYKTHGPLNQRITTLRMLIIIFKHVNMCGNWQ